MKSALHIFAVRDLYLDGTFHLVKNCGAYTQIYIINVLYEENKATFSYHILFSLMKNRFTISYVEILEVLNKFYPLKIYSLTKSIPADFQIGLRICGYPRN